MKKLSSLLVTALLVMAALPASAYYSANFFDDFSDGWSNWTVTGTGYTTESRVRSAPVSGVLTSGSTATRGVPLPLSGNDTGYAEAWAYDDMNPSANDAVSMNLFSDGGISTSHRVAGIYARSTSLSYYYMASAYTTNLFDGVSVPAPTTGLTWMGGPAAPRSVGWHRLRISWDFDYLAGAGTVRWYVDSLLTPKMTMSITSASTRWPYINSVNSTVLGSSASNVAGYWDDVTISVVPEPSSLLALGMGLAGLTSLVRRRRFTGTTSRI